MPSSESLNDALSSFDKLQELDIASLSPTSATDSHFLSGEISLIWPYSSVTHQFSVQLCDSDISKRISKGQIKLVFGGNTFGRAAGELINSGDKLRIALKGSKIVEPESTASEFDSDWMCVWENGVLVQVNDSAPVQIVPDSDVNENETKLESSDVADDEWLAAISSPATPSAQIISRNISIAPSSSIGTPSLWFTPPDILRRRPRPSSDDTFSSGAFLEFEDEMAGPLRKRSKHSRSSSEWVYDDGTLQTSKILDVERDPTMLVAKVGSESSPVQLLSSGASVTDVPDESLSARVIASNRFKVSDGADASTLGPRESAELLHDELYRDLMRQKAVDGSPPSEQKGEHSVMDDSTFVAQAGSVVDQESIAQEDQDTRSENLEKAQSKVYYEILQSKLQNPRSHSGITSSAATAFDGFTGSVEGSDRAKSVDENSIKSAAEPIHVRPHHVVLESAPESDIEDIIPPYPGIGPSAIVRSPFPGSTGEYIGHTPGEDRTSLALSQTDSELHEAPESPAAESGRIAPADVSTTPGSADGNVAIDIMSATLGDLPQSAAKSLAQAKHYVGDRAAAEETVVDVSVEAEQSQSITTTEVIDSQRSAFLLATISGQEATPEDIADDIDMLDATRSVFQAESEVPDVSLGPLQHEAVPRSSPPIIKEQAAPSQSALGEPQSLPKSHSLTQTQPEIADLEDGLVDAETVHNTPLIETILTPMMNIADFPQDIEPPTSNAFPTLEHVLDGVVVNQNDVIEASFTEVIDDALTGTTTGGVLTSYERLEVVIAKDDVVYVEDEVVRIDVENPDSAAAVTVVSPDDAVLISPETTRGESTTGNEVHDGKEGVDPGIYMMDFATQTPVPLYDEDQLSVESVAKVATDELRALATQVLLQQAASELQAGDSDDGAEEDEGEEEFASQAGDATSSSSESESDEDTFALEEEITAGQRPIPLKSFGNSDLPTTPMEIIDIDSDTSKGSGETQPQQSAIVEDEQDTESHEQSAVPHYDKLNEQEVEEGRISHVENQIEPQLPLISAEAYVLEQLDTSIGQLESQAESYLSSATLADEGSRDQYEQQNDDDSYSTSDMIDSEIEGEDVNAIGAEEKRLRKLEEGIVDGAATRKSSSVSNGPGADGDSLDRTHFLAVDSAAEERAKGKGRMLAGLTTPISDYPALEVINLQYLGDFIGAVTSVTPTKWVESVNQNELTGRQYYVHISITDPSYRRRDTLTVYVSRMFEQALPIVQPGDIVLFRNFYISMRKSKFMALSNLESAWAVWKFPSSGDAEPTVEMRGPPVEFGEQESAYAKKLRQWYLSTVSGPADEKLAVSDDK
ncbi:hypothetical protein V1525DRAFT_396187 [Lipomyces kononenkoae]|uniref:Uncharacterized protein n=1 Tax=Lipomyces kononenkoae TaxID=34357 RepID=A0ACC3T9S6_LIPKO